MHIKRFENYSKDPLIKNAYYLVLNSSSVYLLGFIFWIVVARYYPIDIVGNATAIFSLIQLIFVFSNLGLNYSLIRYLPQNNDKNSIINSSITLNFILTLLFTIIFILGIYYWSPALYFIRDNFIYLISFLFLSITFSIFSIQNNIFISLRNARLSLYQSLLFNFIKIPLAISFFWLGLIGLLYSWLIPGLISLIMGFIIIGRILKNYKFFPTLKTLDKEIITYSFSNYVSNIFISFQVIFLPILLVNLWGSDFAAYFYISWSISAPLSFLSSAVTTSLFVEGSYEIGNFRKNVKKSIKIIFSLLIPGIILIFLLGDMVLSIFGSQYSENAKNLLFLLSCASIPLSVSHIYMTIKRVKNEMNAVILINLFLALFMVVGSYFLIGIIGIDGIGISWLLGNLIMALIVIIKLKKNEI